MGCVFSLTEGLRACLQQCNSMPDAHATPAGKWRQAHELRGQLLSYLGNAAGAATLLDVTRYEEYDADKTVDRYLNQRHVKVGVRAGMCS